MLTFVHTADIHFDTPFRAGFTPKQAELRRKEVMQTFLRICEQAKEKDVLLVAGDLFDGRFVSDETLAFVRRCFAQIPHTHVFLAAGNHDPLTADSPYLQVKWSENVHVFGTEMEYVDIPQKKVRVHGRSFSQTHETQSLLTPLQLAGDGWNNLLLLHGEVVATGGESSYNPLEKQALQASGVDYAALGHIHLYSGAERCGKTCYAYPGIPEGRGFDETEERGFLQGVIADGAVRTEWIPSAGRKFLCRSLDVSDCHDGIEIAEQISALIHREGTEHIYRIALEGQLDALWVQPDVLAEQVKHEGFAVELQDHTRLRYDMEALVRENSLRGAFAAAMQAELATMSEADKNIGYLALEMGLDAMERGKLQ